jgi:multicomponent Na+:H+ antiporter subunit F
VIEVAFAVLAAAAALFSYRMLLGPTLADRVIAVNGLLTCGMAALIAEAVRTGSGAFLPALVAVTLVGFVGTGMVARYLEGRGR